MRKLLLTLARLLLPRLALRLAPLLALLTLAWPLPSNAQQPAEAIVIQPYPLQVKSLKGVVTQFAVGQALPPGLKKGDLVELAYAPEARPGPGSVSAASVTVVGATLSGTLKEIAADKTWLIVRSRVPGQPLEEVNVPLQTEEKFWPLVAAMRSGDGINAVYRNNGEVNTVRSLEWQYQNVPRWQRWVSLGGAAVILFMVGLLLTGFKPARLFLGLDNRYSSSQFQTLLWFWVVISAYMAIVFHRMASAGWSYVGGVDIPTNLLILSGVSVLTFTGAKLITSSKQASGDPQSIKTMAAQPRGADLIQDDHRRIDLADFQMIVITGLAVLIYAISTVEFMEHIEFRRVVTMPDVDATLLAVFALGQAAYLGKKAAGEPPAN